MAIRHSTRHPAGSSLSPQPYQLSDLLRRLLVSISHVQLVSQHFGDFSSFAQEDAAAGLTLSEAAKDLDALYGEFDRWHVQTAHRLQPAQDSSAGLGKFTGDDADRPPLDDLPAALPCPFCGQCKDIMVGWIEKHGQWFRAECGVCGVNAPGGETLLEAATHWNTRLGQVQS